MAAAVSWQKVSLSFVLMNSVQMLCNKSNVLQQGWVGGFVCARSLVSNTCHICVLSPYSEESRCRFCQQELPDWKNSLASASTAPPVSPIMVRVANTTTTKCTGVCVCPPAPAACWPSPTWNVSLLCPTHSRRHTCMFALLTHVSRHHYVPFLRRRSSTTERRTSCV